MKPIYCIGGATVDHKLKALTPIQPASSNPVTSFHSYGGVARNVAENLAHWTENIYLQCAVGDDQEGRTLLSYMNKIGVNVNASLIIENARTAQYYAIVAETGDLHVAAIDMMLYDQLKASQFTDHWHQFEKESFIFADTNLSTAILILLIEFCQSKNIKLCIDPVSVAKIPRLPEKLNDIYLLKPNILEAAILADMQITSSQDATTAAKKILKKGLENIVITLGANGYVIGNDNELKHVPANNQDSVVDENGAGDAFCAGILYGLQQKFLLHEACTIAERAATFTTQSLKNVCQTPLSRLYESSSLT